jgi:stage III sporulation protein AG
MSENTSNFRKKHQMLTLALIGGVIGILLLVFGGNADKREKEAAAAAQSDAPQLDARQYSDMLESRVAQICSSVKGVGEVSVFVSLRGGYRTVYAMDSQSSSSGHKYQIVMSGSGSDKSAVVTAYENPEISGVGIVCEGADDPHVRAQIVSLVSAALNISTNKIYVADGSLA